MAILAPGDRVHPIFANIPHRLTACPSLRSWMALSEAHSLESAAQQLKCSGWSQTAGGVFKALCRRSPSPLDIRLVVHQDLIEG